MAPALAEGSSLVGTPFEVPCIMSFSLKNSFIVLPALWPSFLPCFVVYGLNFPYIIGGMFLTLQFSLTGFSYMPASKLVASYEITLSMLGLDDKRVLKNLLFVLKPF